MPVKITAENRQRLEHYSRWLLIALKTEMMALFIFITWQTTSPVLLINQFMPLALIVIFGTIGVIMYKMFQSS